MALLFMDGFDHYASADLGKKGWTGGGSIPQSITIGAGAGRRGGGALSYVSNTLDAYLEHAVAGGPATAVVGFAYKTNQAASSGGTGWSILGFFDGAGRQCVIRLNPSGTLSVLRGSIGSGTVLGTTAAALAIGGTSFDYIECKLTVSPTVGVVELRVNGVVALALTGQNTQNSATSTITSIRVGLMENSPNASTTWVIDDLYILDTTGTANNNFLGDSRVDTLYPNADGTYSAFTPSTGTAHYAVVDDPVLDATDYVAGSTAGNKDSYQFTDLSGVNTVFGVQVCNASMKDDAGARTGANLVKSGVTEAQSAAFGLPTGAPVYNLSLHPLDPATSAAWTMSGLNAAEFGTVVAA